MPNAPDSSADPAPDIAPRQAWMAILARASAEEMSRHLDGTAVLPPHVCLRGPEVGLVMLRGRAGGGGDAFNQGEMTVTRCSVRAGEAVGHAYVAGRDPARAELAARIDAALQTPGLHDVLRAGVVAPLAQAQADRRAAVEAEAQATRVEFFTLATMRT